MTQPAKVVLVILALVIGIPVVGLVGIRIAAFSGHTPTSEVNRLACKGGRLIQETHQAVEGLHDPRIRNTFYVAAQPDHVPPSVRPSFRTYYGKHPTAASARAVDAWFKSCSP